MRRSSERPREEPGCSEASGGSSARLGPPLSAEPLRRVPTPDLDPDLFPQLTRPCRLVRRRVTLWVPRYPLGARAETGAGGPGRGTAPRNMASTSYGMKEVTSHCLPTSL
jgi:hypothetical protein